MISRLAIARELLLSCPPNSYFDYERIVDALKRGDSKEVILNMIEVIRWPKTHRWLKEHL